MLAKIFDLTVLLQGIVSSFLFWLLFKFLKWAFSAVSTVIGKYNSDWKKETLLFEQMQARFMVPDTEAGQRTQVLLLCIYGGLSRAIQAMIYLCFGLIASDLIGPLSIMAYAFAVAYFFRAFRAVFLELSDSKDSAYYARRILEIDAELKALDSRK